MYFTLRRPVLSPDDFVGSEFAYGFFIMKKMVIFDTDRRDSELMIHDGKEAEVIRPLTEEEADLDDIGPMYKIRFKDGTEADAFEDELYDPLAYKTDNAVIPVGAVMDALVKIRTKEDGWTMTQEQFEGAYALVSELIHEPASGIEAEIERRASA